MNSEFPRSDLLASQGSPPEVAGRPLVAQALQERDLRELFETMLEGCVHGQLWPRPNQAPDFLCREVNPSFETQTGLKQVAGKKLSEVVPGIQAANPELFELFDRVVATGRPEKLETHLPALERWFCVSVYRLRPGHLNNNEPSGRGRLLNSLLGSVRTRSSPRTTSCRAVHVDRGPSRGH